MTELLQGEARENALAPLWAAGWDEAEGRDAITKTYRFAGFMQAFGWMTSVAIAAEKLDHHPEWSNTYATVTVVLTTHSAGGLTELDVELAEKMDMLAG